MIPDGPLSSLHPVSQNTKECSGLVLFYRVKWCSHLTEAMFNFCNDEDVPKNQDKNEGKTGLWEANVCWQHGRRLTDNAPVLCFLELFSFKHCNWPPQSLQHLHLVYFGSIFSSSYFLGQMFSKHLHSELLSEKLIEFVPFLEVWKTVVTFLAEFVFRFHPNKGFWRMRNNDRNTLEGLPGLRLESPVKILNLTSRSAAVLLYSSVL